MLKRVGEFLIDPDEPDVKIRAMNPGYDRPLAHQFFRALTKSRAFKVRAGILKGAKARRRRLRRMRRRNYRPEVLLSWIKLSKYLLLSIRRNTFLSIS